MRIGVFAALLLILAVAHPTTSASAERRVALVIGNSAYQNVPKLYNPVNDARAVAALLKNAGFDVVESRSDLGIANIKRAMRDFANVALDADIGVIYYAGHGIEVDGTNYLIPVDAALERDIDVDDETVSLDRVLKSLEPVKRLRLIILDACRDNPFTRSMKRTIASRSVGRGLAKVEPTTSDTVIAFAAKAGSTALDGDAKNSPFTAALLKHLATPGLDLRIAFGQVRDDVLKATSNKQEPFVYGSLGGTTVSLVSAPEPKVAAPSPAPVATSDSVSDVRRDYYEFLNSGATKEGWNDFLQLHPTGPYANLARAQLAKLIDAEKKAADEAKVAEKAAIEKAAGERAAAEKKAAAEKAAADKAAAEKAETEGIAVEKKAAAEKAAEQARITAQAALAKAAAAEPADVSKPQDAATEPASSEIDKTKVGTGRPLECGPREVERGGRCIARTCPSGYSRVKNGTCEKQHEKTRSASLEREKPPTETTRPSRAKQSCRDMIPICEKNVRRGRPDPAYIYKRCTVELYQQCLASGNWHGRSNPRTGLARR
jgi:uncharacterized caspase-like protein